MGRRGRGGKRGGGGGGRANGERAQTKAQKDNDRFGDTPESNEKFEGFYKAQEILPEEEWADFLQKLHDPLPTTFRLTGSRTIAPALNEMIRRVFVPFLSGLNLDGVPLTPPKQIDWYPKQYAWQLETSKQQIRKNEQFKKFQHFLVAETDAGNISRQEAVSMLPPLLLEVEPSHFVLDMCAAPGSKSAQLLEALHTPLPSTSSSTSSAPLPSGLLIANDSDAKRCHLLVHQSLHRIPAAEMMVTNHDASLLPGLRVPNPEPGDRHTPNRKMWIPVLFDRILADVPCSGDGTLRKNLGIWRDWNSGNGVGLHSLQLRILLRGIQLLKPGGRLVYSTCSMNPMENESVVSAALEACPDMSILPVPHLLPTLKRRPGLTTWTVLDNNLNPVPFPTSDNETKGGERSEKGKPKIWNKSLFPNGKEKERGLEHCWRLYPHLNDTGAFFVAVLVKKEAEKVEAKVEVNSDDVAMSTESTETSSKRAARSSSPPPEEPSVKRLKPDESAAIEEAIETAASSVEPAKEDEEEEPITVPEKEEPAAEVDLATLPADAAGVSVKQGTFKEEPYIYLSPDDEQVKLVIDFFDLSPSFPTDSILVRNAQGLALRTLYFTSPLLRTLLSSNSYTRMRLISCGTKLFVKQGQESGEGTLYRCKWRVASEGLEVVRPFMGPKRIISCDVEMLKVLMKDINISFETIAALEGQEKFLERLNEMEMGSCVLEVKAQGEGISTEQDLILPFWRSKTSCNLMVEKLEKSALSNRLWGEDFTPHAPGVKKRDQKKAEEKTAEESGATTEVEDRVVEEFF